MKMVSRVWAGGRASNLSKSVCRGRARPFAMLAVFLALAFVGAFSARGIDFVHEGGTANTGARFFLETRFSRFFYANSGGNANAILTNGDPVEIGRAHV